MSRGRRRTPIERRQAQARGDGRTPSKLPVPVTGAVTVTSNRRTPPAPRGLGPRGRLEWRKIWTAGFWLKDEQDYHWVEMISRSYSDIEVFRKQIEEEGLVVTGYAGQPAAHPLIAEIRKCEATIQKCLSILGFSPTDRARLMLGEAKAQNAVLEMMANKDRDKQGSHQGA